MVRPARPPGRAPSRRSPPDADGVIATGQRTGDGTTLGEIDEVGAATALPLPVGSGVTPDDVAAILARVDGVIVASSLERDGRWWNEVELARGSALVEATDRRAFASSGRTEGEWTANSG